MYSPIIFSDENFPGLKSTTTLMTEKKQGTEHT